MRRPRARLVTSHSGGVGAPPGWPLRAACQELADDRHRRRKRGPTPKENAAVERRKASALRQGRAAARRKLVRLSALRSPRSIEGKAVKARARTRRGDDRGWN
jgi:hypothetical protein